jgi:hypothetical protein
LLKWFRLRGFGQGTRNDLPGFESQGFIKQLDDSSRIEFDYHVAKIKAKIAQGLELTRG